MALKSLMTVLTVCGSLMLSACVTEQHGVSVVKLKKVSSKEKAENTANIRAQQAMEFMSSRETYRNAVESIESAVKYNSHDKNIWMIRASIYQYLKEYDKTEESFRRAFEIDPGYAELNNNYGWYLCSIKQQPNQAIPYFDRALADTTYAYPESAYMNKGICSAKMHQYHLADSYFERALRANPEYVPIFRAQAQAKMDSGNFSEADRLFRMYQSKVPQLSAEDLLMGWRISRANGETQAAYEYEQQLRMNHPYSEETATLNTESRL